MARSVLPDLKKLEATYRSAAIDCPVVFLTRVREPLQYYLSFYRWGVAFRQRDKPHDFGHNFTQWVERNPNLQSTIMLRGMAAMEAEYYGHLSPMRPRPGRRPSRAEFMALRRNRAHGRGVPRNVSGGADHIESHWRDVQART